MRPKLLFVSPRYLLPADSGGKIRSGQILRGLKGGKFEVILASPAPAGAAVRDATALAAMCDRFASWPEPVRGPLFTYTRMRHILSALPVSVATDVSTPARRLVAAELASRPDVIVIDFIHAAVLMPERFDGRTVLFTHNVEAEIFERHLKVAASPLYRAIWRNQFDKMRRFEARALSGVDRVIAVSERDRKKFRDDYGVEFEAIETGVDLDYLHFASPREISLPATEIVFTASMDSFANIDGVQWFMSEIWPLVVAGNPAARVTIVGRNPDAKLVRQAKERGLPWIFTGSVEDVRPYVHKGSVYVIPLRVGGGTRLKGYEAMALGRPMVSTSLGVEGLHLEAGRHYLAGDTPAEFANAVLKLLNDGALRERMAQDARRFVEERFSFERVAKSFEVICARAL